jgi:hypothetical protein
MKLCTSPGSGCRQWRGMAEKSGRGYAREYLPYGSVREKSEDPAGFDLLSIFQDDRWCQVSRAICGGAAVEVVGTMGSDLFGLEKMQIPGRRGKGGGERRQ